MIGGAVSGNITLGAIGLGVVKIGGWIIKITLLVKLFSKLRRKKTVKAEDMQDVNEVDNSQLDLTCI